MNSRRQDREGSADSEYEKRKHPEGGSVSRSGSFSKLTASREPSGKKKLKPDVESTSSSNSNSQSSAGVSSSSSSTGSAIIEGTSTKSNETSKKRREPSKCPYCSVVMTRSHDLRKHVEKLHQGSQEILCHMCDFRATDIVLYLSHENDHLCRCPYCGFLARNYRGLPRHKTFCRKNPNFQGETQRTVSRRRGKSGAKKH